ncbi:GntR family transcriptional regulator [Mesorhizobium shangrilense]|uniref:GntR family transcriptional regulator n=1 Tax=Mesorhizobium shangrilense TaxID=460060 RepID=A0ABV2DE38_9HYPH
MTVTKMSKTAPLSPAFLNKSDAFTKTSGVAAAQQVFSMLLNNILTFKLKPYDELSEARLSEQLGVSRTPVREALARLASLQLVDIFPQRGTVIAPLRAHDLLRSQFLRESLELGLLRRAIRSPERPWLVETLRGELTLQSTLATLRDEQRFYVSDELFHRQIASSAGLPDIWKDISDAKLHMDRFRHLMLASVETLPVIVDQHKAIVDAIERGDVTGAQDAMKKHLRRIFAFLDAAFAAHPEYFERSGPALSQSMTLDD